MSDNKEDKNLQREAEERIRELCKRRDVSQAELSLTIGLAPNTIQNYFAVKRIPSAMACLCLAGISDSDGDREFWIRASKLDSQQLHLIRRGLGIKTTGAGPIGEIADLMDNPGDRWERAVVDMVRVALQNREENRS